MTIENFLSDARSVITLVSFLTFIGIVWWAYSARRIDQFRAAAMLPFDENDQGHNVENRHG